MYVCREERQVYTENLPDIFHLLEVSAQSGTLTLTPAKDEANSPWQAICLLREGKIIEIKVRQAADGAILLGEAAALDWLCKQKGVYWHFKELPPEALSALAARPTARENTRRVPEARPPQRRPPFAFGMESIPRRTPLGVQLGVPPYQWSREHRTVFLLVDGARSKAEILRLLPVTFGAYIDQILMDLKSAGLIE